METPMIRFAAATAALALIALTSGTAAAQSTGTITLNGTVVESCTVGVTDSSAALDLVGGESNTAVGAVVETCNSGDGYTVTLTSANSGRLTSSAPGSTPIAYTVAYDGQSAALSSALTLTRNDARFNQSRNLAVSLTGSNQYIAGDYADTITVTIAAR